MSGRADLGATRAPGREISLDWQRGFGPAIDRTHVRDASLVALEHFEDGEDCRPVHRVDAGLLAECVAHLSKPRRDVGAGRRPARLPVTFDHLYAVLPDRLAE